MTVQQFYVGVVFEDVLGRPGLVWCTLSDLVKSSGNYDQKSVMDLAGSKNKVPA